MEALLKIGLYTIMCEYLRKNPTTGIYEYRRKIPATVRHHFSKPKNGIIVKSLSTRDPNKARKALERLNRQYESEWRALEGKESWEGQATIVAAHAILKSHNVAPGDRTIYKNAPVDSDFEIALQQVIDPNGLGEHNPDAKVSIEDRLSPEWRAATLLYEDATNQPMISFSEAKDFYIDFNGETRKKSLQEIERITLSLTSELGDKPLNDFRRDDANQLVSTMITSGLAGASVRRYLNRIKAIVSVAIREKELNITNVWESLSVPATPDRTTKKQSFTDVELKAIQSAAREKDDSARWMVLMLSDTGCRLNEVVGLRIADIHVNEKVPYIDIRWTEERRLKNEGSARKIPLVGDALWAAQRAIDSSSSQYAFPKYIKDDKAQSSSASAALNKWLRSTVGITSKSKTIHSFRHCMRDRLRNVGTPEETIDYIGGWTGAGSVGRSYGSWNFLTKIREHLHSAVTTKLG